MSSLIGYYSLIFGVGVSILVIFFSIKNFNDTQKLDTKVISLVFLQLLFVIISFSGLILSFVNSDFSNETVFNHSHTTKPLFYKISRDFIEKRLSCMGVIKNCLVTKI